MKLYLLACQNIQRYLERILPELPEQRQLAYARSHSGLTLGAGLLLAFALNVHRDDDLIIGPYGKPSLSNGKAEFSLSHSRDHVLLSVSSGPIGADMEHRDRLIPPSVQNRICLPVEQGLDPLLVFTRKECAMKLTGLGFSLPLQQIDTTADFFWKGSFYRFFSAEQEGYLISILSAEKELPAIQLLTPEELL